MTEIRRRTRPIRDLRTAISLSGAAGGRGPKRNKPRRALRCAHERLAAQGDLLVERQWPLNGRHDDGAERGERIYAIKSGATAEAEAAAVGSTRSPRDPERGLAESRLLVDAALASQHQIRVLQGRVEAAQ